jgi:hypothetical protein
MPEDTGHHLSLRYDDTGGIEAFPLGVRGVEDADIDVNSMQSPLGAAGPHRNDIRKTSKENAHKRLRGSPMSPTSPTFVTLNDQLIKAHRRIRELEAGEAELLAQNRTLCAAINELTHVVHARSGVELTSSTVQTSWRTHRQPPTALRRPPSHA